MHGYVPAVICTTLPRPSIGRARTTYLQRKPYGDPPFSIITLGGAHYAQNSLPPINSSLRWPAPPSRSVPGPLPRSARDNTSNHAVNSIGNVSVPPLFSHFSPEGKLHRGLPPSALPPRGPDFPGKRGFLEERDGGTCFAAKFGGGVSPDAIFNGSLQPS